MSLIFYQDQKITTIVSDTSRICPWSLACQSCFSNSAKVSGELWKWRNFGAKNSSGLGWSEGRPTPPYASVSGKFGGLPLVPLGNPGSAIAFLCGKWNQHLNTNSCEDVCGLLAATRSQNSTDSLRKQMSKKILSFCLFFLLTTYILSKTKL